MGKLSKAHWHEVSDRIYVIQQTIEEYVRNHPTIIKNKKLKKILDKAQEKLSELYQKTGSKM